MGLKDKDAADDDDVEGDEMGEETVVVGRRKRESALLGFLTT